MSSPPGPALPRGGGGAAVLGALGLLVALNVATGLRGVDFGYHWDEEKCQLVPLRHSLEAGTLLPAFYMYPSVSHWLNLAGLAPDLVTVLVRGGARERLLALTRDPGFLLRLRRLHVGATALGLAWVWLAVRAWGKSGVEALLAAGILGLSWECAYHARWVAPDSVTMQFGALTLLLILRLLRHPRPRARRLAAFAAALACGTKYPAGLLLGPVLVAVWLGRDRARGLRDATIALAETVGVFAAGFLLTTPGAVLEAGTFREDVRLMTDWYGEWGLFGYTVSPGPPHLARMLEYLGLVLFSPYAPVALVVSSFALVGGWAAIRESRGVGGLLVGFPLAYLLYFSTQRVMVARNLLLLAPFLAVLAARGVAAAAGRLPGKPLRAALAVTMGSLLAANAFWLVRAAESIRHRGESARFVAALARYVDARPQRRFLVSPRVAAELARDGRARPNAGLTLSPSTEGVVVYAFEAMRAPTEWPANNRRLTEAAFGPQEVNFNYYPTWLGNDRILVLSMEQAQRARVRLLRRAERSP